MLIQPCSNTASEARVSTMHGMRGPRTKPGLACFPRSCSSRFTADSIPGQAGSRLCQIQNWGEAAGMWGAHREPLSPRQAPLWKDLLLLPLPHAPQYLVHDRAAGPSALMEERDFLEVKGRERASLPDGAPHPHKQTSRPWAGAVPGPQDSARMHTDSLGLHVVAKAAGAPLASPLTATLSEAEGPSGCWLLPSCEVPPHPHRRCQLAAVSQAGVWCWQLPQSSRNTGLPAISLQRCSHHQFCSRGSRTRGRG